MPKVIFAQELIKYTKTQEYILSNNSITVSNALIEVMNTFPQLLIYTTDNSAKIIVSIDDNYLIDKTSLQHTNFSTLVLTTVPTGEIEGAAVFLANAAAVAADYSMLVYDIVVVMATAVLTVGAGIAISAVLGALSDKVAEPTQGLNTMGNSATYTFSGIQNTVASGTSLQIVYGTHRVGGQILSQFIKYENTASKYMLDTYLYGQYGVSEGPIESISDVAVNKLSSNFYSGVTVSQVLGEETQEIMPEFSQVTTTLPINFKVNNLDTPP